MHSLLVVDNQLLFSSGADNQILVWDIAQGATPTEPVQILTVQSKAYALAFHNGRLLAGGEDQTVSMW